MVAITNSSLFHFENVPNLCSKVSSVLYSGFKWQFMLRDSRERLINEKPHKKIPAPLRDANFFAKTRNKPQE